MGVRPREAKWLTPPSPCASPDCGVGLPWEGGQQPRRGPAASAQRQLCWLHRLQRGLANSAWQLPPHLQTPSGQASGTKHHIHGGPRPSQQFAELGTAARRPQPLRSRGGLGAYAFPQWPRGDPGLPACALPVTPATAPLPEEVRPPNTFERADVLGLGFPRPGSSRWAPASGVQAILSLQGHALM